MTPHHSPRRAPAARPGGDTDPGHPDPVLPGRGPGRWSWFPVRPWWAKRVGERQRGSASLELVILLPVMLMTVMLIVAGGRLVVARQVMQAAVAHAARSASIARTPEHATTAATSAATTALQDRSLHCLDTAVDVDTSGFAVPVGRPATVAATVECTLALSDLGLPGMPGQVTVTATATSPLDTYRER